MHEATQAVPECPLRRPHGQLIYSAITSLDGHNADEDGNFDWAASDEEVHTFVNDLEWPVRTYHYGRRMYEVMAVWETDPTLATQREFAVIGRRPTGSCTQRDPPAGSSPG